MERCARQRFCGSCFCWYSCSSLSISWTLCASGADCTLLLLLLLLSLSLSPLARSSPHSALRHPFGFPYQTEAPTDQDLQNKSNPVSCPTVLTLLPRISSTKYYFSHAIQWPTRMPTQPGPMPVRSLLSPVVAWRTVLLVLPFNHQSQSDMRTSELILWRYYPVQVHTYWRQAIWSRWPLTLCVLNYPDPHRHMKGCKDITVVIPWSDGQ